MALRPEQAQLIREEIDRELSRYFKLLGVPSLLAVLLGVASIVWFVFSIAPGVVASETERQISQVYKLRDAMNEGFVAVGKTKAAADTIELELKQRTERLQAAIKSAEAALADFTKLMQSSDAAAAQTLNQVLKVLGRPDVAASLRALRTAVRCGTRTVADHLGPPWISTRGETRTDSVIRILFDANFLDVPKVFAAWSGIDAPTYSDGGSDPRTDYSVYVANIGQDGFDLHVVTRNGFRFDDNRVTWIALGAGDRVDEKNSGACTRF